MPNYAYRARDEKGMLVRGVMEAASSDELSAKLHKMGYMVTAISPEQPEIQLKAIIEKFRFKRIRLQDMVVFNFHLANMIEAGIPILAALRGIESQTENKRLKEVIADTRRTVEAGSLFSASLAKHGDIFNKLFINMVRAGEESGRLNEVLKRYAVYSEAQAELREKIKGALFYPAILLVASFLVILFIVTFIIPQFVGLFSKAGVRLPLVTQLLYAVGLGLKKYWYLMFAGCGVILFGINKYRRTKRGKMRFDSLLLRAPVAGALLRKVYISRFSRTLATLLSSGVPILQSLDIVKEVVGNEVIAGAVVNVRQSVEHGEGISGPLKVSREFPADTLQMIAAGEETGDLEGMLDKIADFYDMSVNFAVKKLTAIIEPLFLVIMGIIVAFIMASMLLPIFDMVKVLRH